MIFLSKELLYFVFSFKIKQRIVIYINCLFVIKAFTSHTVRMENNRNLFHCILI